MQIQPKCDKKGINAHGKSMNIRKSSERVLSLIVAAFLSTEIFYKY